MIRTAPNVLLTDDSDKRGKEAGQRTGVPPRGTGTESRQIDVGRLVTSTQQPQRRRAYVRAPELVGRGWLNTGGKSYSIKDLRGKIVLLDF